MPPKQQQVVSVIKDEEQFLNLISSENKKLVLLDVHPDWCGPCEMMIPTYKTLQTSIDDFEKRVDIYTLGYGKILTYKHDKFNREPTSKPRFVFYQEGRLVDEVQGADIPAIIERVYKYLPMVY
ncbi:unnamed protein product [Paramecium primaurelia]|uniref:Thioredoxin domain-containing protein n=1 Tax=Paramecium primaurelia TaxID=5886 RepID=A0A8S1M125_PARPR|nr:unnamed protein product [Paramecium primaurelia]